MTALSLTAVANGFMQDASPTVSMLGDGGFIATGWFSIPYVNRALLLFPIEEFIGTDGTVNSATLKLTVQNNFLSGGETHTLNVYRLKRKWWGGDTTNPSSSITNRGSWSNYRQDLTMAWSTGGAGDTTNDRDATPIGSVVINAATSGQVSITLDTTLTQEMIDGTVPNYGFVLVASVEDSVSLVRWLPMQDATASNRPILDLDVTYASHELTDSLVAWWSLDSNSWADATAGGYTLTPTNTPTETTGLVDGAAHFVAASNQSVSNSSANLKTAGDFTWAGWVNLTNKTALYGVASARGSDVKGWGLFYHQVDILDYFVAQLCDDDGELGDSIISDVVGSSGGNPSAGTWIHIVVRHDATRKFLQLIINNGYPDSAGHHANDYRAGNRGPYVGDPVISTGAFMMGREARGLYPMSGDIDEAAYWSRWLSNAEIATLYNSGSGMAYPGGGGEPAATAVRLRALLGVGI